MLLGTSASSDSVEEIWFFCLFNGVGSKAPFGNSGSLLFDCGAVLAAAFGVIGIVFTFFGTISLSGSSDFSNLSSLILLEPAIPAAAAVPAAALYIPTGFTGLVLVP